MITYRITQLVLNIVFWISSPVLLLLYVSVLIVEYTFGHDDQHLTDTGGEIALYLGLALASFCLSFPVWIVITPSVLIIRNIAPIVGLPNNVVKKSRDALAAIYGATFALCSFCLIPGPLSLYVYVWQPLFKETVPRVYNLINSRIYTPLDTDAKQIRTLLLLPGRNNQAICCTLHIQAIDGPAFEALSYTWSAQNALRKRIYVDGISILVTKNVLNALRALRHSAEARRLWIDQLCINQADVLERGHQVQHCMKLVYSSAQQVVVWLGSERNQKLPQYVQMLYKMAGRVIAHSHVDIPALHTFSNISLDDVLAFDDTPELSTASLNADERTELEAYKRILQRHWWKRVWVIQEVALARQIVLKIGNSEINWDQFCDTLLQKFKIGSDQRKLLAIRTNNKDNSLSDLSLLSLALTFSDQQASDSRDKLFSLCGLARANEAFVTVDYRRDEDDVFADFTSEIIRSTKSLEILSLARRTNSWQFGCTWSVPWHELTKSAQKAFWGYNAYRPTSVEAPDYNACDGLQAEIRKHSSFSQLLCIKGIMTSKIRSLGMPYPTVPTNAAAVMEQWFAHTGLDQNLPMEHPLMSKFLETIRLGLSSEVHTYLDFGRLMWPGRRFFITEEGHYGLGPDDTRIGDRICIAPGSGVPLILRHRTKSASQNLEYWITRTSPQERMYGFVGFCYVSDLMCNPELASSVSAGTVALEDLWLF